MKIYFGRIIERKMSNAESKAPVLQNRKKQVKLVNVKLRAAERKYSLLYY